MLHKINIWSEECPKISLVGYYWNEYTMSEVMALLKEHQDLFPQSLTDRKNIKEELGEMNMLSFVQM